MTRKKQKTPRFHSLTPRLRPGTALDLRRRFAQFMARVARLPMRSWGVFQMPPGEFGERQGAGLLLGGLTIYYDNIRVNEV